MPINIKLKSIIWHKLLYNLISNNNGWAYENIGKGKSINVEKHKWTFPPPKSRGENFLNIVCKIASTKQASNKTY